MLTALDGDRLHAALALAEGSIGLSDPNPRVGCIVGWPDGRVAGRGFTQEAGAAHAEVMALRDAAAQGIDPRGATAWVTLEPCAHHGRTPPCCDALIASGIRRVVVAVGDPFPHVAGAGLARLRAAGIEVVLADAPVAAAARELNIGFFSRMERGRPFVRVKAALSADGRMALCNGVSQWITGAAARSDGHAWRRRAGAVLTGIGTVLADDPRLDVREVPTRRQPLRVVLDPRLRTPPQARILQPPGEVLLVHTAGAEPPAWLAGSTGIEAWGAPARDGRPDLAAVLEMLAGRGINEVHVEAGPRLNGAWQASGLIDEWLLYVAPMLTGPGLPLAELPLRETLEGMARHAWVGAEPVGGDLRLRMRPLPRAADDVGKIDSPTPRGRWGSSAKG